ncbi:MAG: type II toxin-antitoxin system HicA family toxin [Terriglobia bacterium]
MTTCGLALPPEAQEWALVWVLRTVLRYTSPELSLSPCRPKSESWSRTCNLPSAGFVDRGGKGSHRDFVHPNVKRPIKVSGQPGDDAKKYQIRAVRKAIEESQK